MKRFEGRRAVVTGAASGIGLQIVVQLLAEGAQVLGCDLDPTGIPDGAEKLRVDVGAESDIVAMARQADAEFGGIDHLFNNAGIGSTTSVVSATFEEWETVFRVNARGVFLGMKYTLPGMLDRGFGSIVNTASVAALVGFPDRASYTASKGAVVALTKQVAIQYARSGVRCNCICPGTIETHGLTRLLEQAEDRLSRRSELAARQPMGRLGAAAEVANAALYLASDDAAFITGAALVVDGGLTAAHL